MAIINPRALAATTVAVAPVETTLGTFDTINSDWLTILIYNTSSTQTFDGYLRLSARQDVTTQVMPSAVSESTVLRGIAPLESRCVDVQVCGVRTIEVSGTMGGVGANVVIAVNNKAEH